MYIVSYDISSDRLRNKIVKVLLNYGKRVQYSVFECDISQESFGQMYKKLTMLMADSEEGNIRFYHLCKKCEKEVQEIGIPKGNVCRLEDVVII